MAKRFTDTEKFSDTWYRKLSLLHKVIWEYLLSECNHAGILENFDLEMMSFKIGANITLEDLKIFDGRITFINDTTIFIPKFLDFQYGCFNPKNKVHLNVLKELDKYKISAPWTGRERSVYASKEKEQEQEKEKEKEEDNLKLYGKDYQNVCLSKTQYGKLLAMCASEKLLNELIDSFSEKIEVGKERPYTAELPNAHYERLKSFYNYRKRNPEKFITDGKDTSRPYNKIYTPKPVIVTDEERKQSEGTIKKLGEMLKSKQVIKTMPL